MCYSSKIVTSTFFFFSTRFAEWNIDKSSPFFHSLPRGHASWWKAACIHVLQHHVGWRPHWIRNFLGGSRVAHINSPHPCALESRTGGACASRAYIRHSYSTLVTSSPKKACLCVSLFYFLTCFHVLIYYMIRHVSPQTDAR